MITFRIEHTLHRDGLISALCWTQRDNEPDDSLPRWSKAEVERQVRDVLRYAGAEDFFFWGDSVDDSELHDRIVAWATEHVDRVWPDRTAAR